MSTRTMILQGQQVIYEEMRVEFEAIGAGGRYCQQQKEYALKLIGEYGPRAAARILEIPRSDLSPEITAIDEVRISL